MSAAPLYSESVIMLQLSVISAQIFFECNKIVERVLELI